MNNEIVAVDGHDSIKEKILHVLSIYHRVSPSMLQTGIGTSLPPALWRPVLAQLIKEKKVVQEEVAATAPSGHLRMYVTLSLKPSPSQAVI